MLKSGQLREMWVVASQTHLQFNMVSISKQKHPGMPAVPVHADFDLYLQVVFMTCCLLLAIVAVTYVLTRTKPVYLINYHCYKPPDR